MIPTMDRDIPSTVETAPCQEKSGIDQVCVQQNETVNGIAECLVVKQITPFNKGDETLTTHGTVTLVGEESSAGQETVPLFPASEVNLSVDGSVSEIAPHVEIEQGVALPPPFVTSEVSLAGQETGPLLPASEVSLADHESEQGISLSSAFVTNEVSLAGQETGPLLPASEVSLADHESEQGISLSSAFVTNEVSLAGQETGPLLPAAEVSLADHESVSEVAPHVVIEHGVALPSAFVTSEASLAGQETGPLLPAAEVSLADHESVSEVAPHVAIEQGVALPSAFVTSEVSLTDHETVAKIPGQIVAEDSVDHEAGLTHEEIVVVVDEEPSLSKVPSLVVAEASVDQVPLVGYGRIPALVVGEAVSPRSLSEVFLEEGTGDVLAEVKDRFQLQLTPAVNGGAGVCATRKSPVTVQEWVDSLPAPAHRSEDDTEELPLDDVEEVLDLGLGAEAGLLYDAVSPSVTIVRPQVTPEAAARILARESSVQSDNSHGSSVESYLESRKPDPEEVLISLGFGGRASPLDCEVSRIPRRFLQPSKVKGVAIEDFLRYQQDLIETFETGFCGYHGLSGSSHSMPSIIVAKIMEKLRERESCTSVATSEPTSAPASPPPVEAGKQRFSNVARRVLKRTSVLGAIPSRQPTSLSVLNADNRRFLESQGAKSPEVPRKRMVIGHRSYTFGCDGEMIEVTKPKPLIHKDSVLSSATSLSLTSVDSDSDTDERSDTFEMQHHSATKRCTFPGVTNWDSDKLSRCESIHEDVEMKGPDSVFEEPDTASRRGSLVRQQRIAEQEAMEVICETDSHLNVAPDPRGDSFEMEEIGAAEDEARSVPLSRARSDSSGFLEGDSEHAETARLRGGDLKRLSLPVVCVHDERGSLLISRSCSLHSLGSDSSGSLQHRSQSVPNTLSLGGSTSSVSNMFSSCSDESVIQVGTAPSADLEDLLRELAGRGVSLSPRLHSPSAGQSSRYEADAIRLALGAYSNQLVGGTSSLELLDSGPPEARREIQAVREIRGQIAAELRRVAALLEEQPGPRAAAITRQMTVLLREQTRLCHQLESLSQGSSFSDGAPACCNSERLLGAMREENRRLERLVESHSQELAEIRQLLQQLVSRNS